EAIAYYTACLALRPDNVVAYWERGNVHAHLGQWDASQDDNSAALAVAKNDRERAFVLNSQAWVYAACPIPQVRKPARAVELALKAVELNPKQSYYWNTLGVAHYRAGDWKGAIGALEESIRLTSDIRAYNGLFLAMAHWQLGDRDQARAWYDTSVA